MSRESFDMVTASADRPSVLVVDDVEANLVAAQALLGDLDCEVVCVGSGNDALRHLLRREFAAVLLDVQMPEMDGFEVARLARGSPHGREVPIIFVTAMPATEEGLFRGYESGAVDVLFKPLDPHILTSKVKVFLELYRSRQRLAGEIDAHKRTLADLDAFNYSVAHDLRAPLRPLMGFSQIVLEDYGPKLDDEGKRLLERIAAGATRMDRLIDDLLRFARISRTQPRSEPVDLATVAAAVTADLRAADPGRVVEVTIATEMKARGDASLLRIALENLLRNAWKFTTKTSAPVIEVGSALEPGERSVAYFVRDNGVGFDPQQSGRLFRAFERLHSRDDFDGTGIGLAIVHRIIQHHRGRVWADGAPQRGATFWFTLG